MIANPSFGSQEGFLEEVVLLTVKNENICQIIREEGECAKMWQQTGARSVLGTADGECGGHRGEGGFGRSCYCWGWIVSLKKEMSRRKGTKKKDIEVLTTPPPVPKSRTVFGNKVFTEYSS